MAILTKYRKMSFGIQTIDEVKKYEVNPENNQYLNITDNDQNALNQWIN